MIFSLVSSAQEWLNVKWDEFKKEEENREQKKLKELEEAEQVMLLSFIMKCFFFLPFDMCNLIAHLTSKTYLLFIFTETIRRHSCNSRNIFELAQRI